MFIYGGDLYWFIINVVVVFFIKLFEMEVIYYWYVMNVIYNNIVFLFRVLIFKGKFILSC